MPFCAALLFLGLMGPEPPLQVAGVLREGLPPFETGERLYRLEGAGWKRLHPGQSLRLRREGERAKPGLLRVLELKGGYALARLAEPGDTYPLRGDLALPAEPMAALPAFGPAPREAARLAGPAREPKEPPSVPASPAQPRHRGTIWFLKTDAGLTEGAHARLKEWAEAWGRAGRWVLRRPLRSGDSAGLDPERLEALKAALARLGVKVAAVEEVPEEEAGPYDGVEVREGPW